VKLCFIVKRFFKSFYQQYDLQHFEINAKTILQIVFVINMTICKIVLHAENSEIFRFDNFLKVVKSEPPEIFR